MPGSHHDPLCYVLYDLELAFSCSRICYRFWFFIFSAGAFDSDFAFAVVTVV
jgi:hypothetical protein